MGASFRNAGLQDDNTFRVGFGSADIVNIAPVQREANWRSEQDTGELEQHRRARAALAQEGERVMAALAQEGESGMQEEVDQWMVDPTCSLPDEWHGVWTSAGDDAELLEKRFLS